MTCLSSSTDDQEELLALDEALDKLDAEQPRNAELVKLRYFAGLNIRRGGRKYWAFPARPPNETGPTPGPGCTDG